MRRSVVTPLALLCAFSVLGCGSGVRFAQFSAFGDSITVGYNADPASTNSWVNRLGNSLHLVPENKAIAGSFAADQLDPLYATQVSGTGRQLFTVMLGMNDKTASTSPEWQTTDGLIMQDILAWLGTPTHKTAQEAIGAGACTTTGSWTVAAYADSGLPIYGGIGIQSSQIGATLSCAISAGTVAYLGALMQENGAQGSYSVAVDGQAVATYSTWGPGNNFHQTIHGRHYGDRLIRLPLDAGATSHTITVTVTNGAVPTAIEWVGSNAQVATSGAPFVIASGPTPNGVGAGDPAILNPQNVAFQQLMKDAVEALSNDGLPVHYVDAYSYMNAAHQDISPDGTHPLGDGTKGVTDGHYHIYQAFSDAL